MTIHVRTIYREGTAPVEAGRIFCLTRNYAAHAKEMGADPTKLPSIFMKPATAIVQLEADRDVPVTHPSHGKDLHHEVELVMLCLNPDDNRYAFGVGVDLTLRDIQADLKARSLPWEAAKAFDQSAPVGSFFEAHLLNRETLRIELYVNEELRQSGTVDQMIIPLEEIPSYVGRIFPLRPGDLIFTGTPEGVASIQRGDRVEISLQDGSRLLEKATFTIA
ncbi:MAG TPA: fumarylacetoacetate hydrolase family protein [Thermoanaerobaculia bacterium]|nr:fumarylacetoacetate hydrolase family protein [Thermoanaerobaculia bacterium]HUM31004.1 fumarylacetoacetate hydrolase family protein [Thermoanaerobaculia bacterium]HXK69302.1 fumarylacetoacetate hydrolase family protein [Thermoanaerobaculia bacterium]